MDSAEGVWIALFLVAALAVVGLALRLIVLGFWGAAVILTFAAEQGFVGMAAYVACWVFLFPLMLIVSIVVGLLANRAAKNEERQREARGWGSD